MPTITFTDARKKENIIFIDTRSPKEFAEDHIPGALNVPLLDDEERAIVGTLYKQVSRDKAVEVGIEFFAKKLPVFVKPFNEHRDKTIIVYCWRGGMRSKCVVDFLYALKYPVVQMEGGYKSYRAYIREKLENFQLRPKVVVLWGLTCTGKTALLQLFPNCIDLEGLAQHRSSLYGAIGLTPRSQKMFDSLLLQELERLSQEKVIFMEGESRKIGDVQMPDFLFKAMKQGMPILIRRSVEKRVELAVREYFKLEFIPKIKEITQLLWRVIGKKKKEEMIACLDKGEYATAAKILLMDYYDPLYQHTLKELSFVKEINTDNLEKARKELLALTENYPERMP